MNPGKAIQNKINGVKQNFADYKKLDSRDKKTYWKEFLLNNALYILQYHRQWEGSPRTG